MGMEHVYQNHISLTAPRGKSVFKSNRKHDVKNLVDETINYPDIVKKHSSDPDREIYIRDFGYTVGTDGFYGCECKRVRVVYNFKVKVVITAYPEV